MMTIQGAFAASLISFEKKITPNPFATDDLISNAGTITIPAGYGIVTTSEILQPYWHPKLNGMPIRIELTSVNPDIPYHDELSLIGTNYYQFGNEVIGNSFSNGEPLTIVNQYFANTSASIPYNVLMYQSLDKSDEIHEYNLEYSAEYRPIPVNHSSYEEGYPSGVFTTNKGLLNISHYTGMPNSPVIVLSGKFDNGDSLNGILHGPIWFGEWISNQSVPGSQPPTYQLGWFFMIFTEKWSEFSGTIGDHLESTKNGNFSGEKEIR